jgi:hypothetical protein
MQPNKRAGHGHDAIKNLNVVFNHQETANTLNDEEFDIFRNHRFFDYDAGSATRFEHLEAPLSEGFYDKMAKAGAASLKTDAANASQTAMPSASPAPMRAAPLLPHGSPALTFTTPAMAPAGMPSATPAPAHVSPVRQHASPALAFSTPAVFPAATMMLPQLSTTTTTAAAAAPADSVDIGSASLDALSADLADNFDESMFSGECGVCVPVFISGGCCFFAFPRCRGPMVPVGFTLFLRPPHSCALCAGKIKRFANGPSILCDGDVEGGERVSARAQRLVSSRPPPPPPAKTRRAPPAPPHHASEGRQISDLRAHRRPNHHFWSLLLGSPVMLCSLAMQAWWVLSDRVISRDLARS